MTNDESISRRKVRASSFESDASFVTRHSNFPRRGFSLIELLVVIGIMAILIGLLLPSLRAAREQAKSVQCLSQLRQVGYAIQQYANANRGLLPTWSYRHEYPNDPFLDSDPTGPGWIVLLERHIGQKPDGAVWNCPAWPDGERRINYFLGAKWMREQNPMIRTMPITRIRNSTTYILSGDCTAQDYYPPPWGTNPDSLGDDIDKDDARVKCLRFRGDPAGGYNMHRVGNNVLFADNHAATFVRFEPGQLTYSPLSQADWDEVVPE